MTTATLTVSHPVTGEALPPFLTARQAAELIGRPETWVGLACERGELPTLPHTRGTAWSIPTLELLRAAGFTPPIPEPRHGTSRPVQSDPLGDAAATARTSPSDHGRARRGPGDSRKRAS